MRLVAGRLHLISLVVLFALAAGCVQSPPQSPPEETNAPHLLTDGWSYSTSGGDFHYADKRFHAEYEGDQFALEINNREKIYLGPLTWDVQGELDLDYDHSLTLVYAVWDMNEPWPRSYSISTSVTEWAGVGTDAGGDHVHQSVESIVIGEGGYRFTLMTGNISLEPGTWRIWFGVANSLEMEVQVDLPEPLPLLAPPKFSPGCDLAHPSDFESTLLVHANLIASYARDAHWNIHLEDNETLLGNYFGRIGLTSMSHVKYTMPDGSNREYLTGGTADPPEWNGRVISSTTAGEHTFDVYEEMDVVLGGSGPKLAYCVL